MVSGEGYNSGVRPSQRAKKTKAIDYKPMATLTHSLTHSLYSWHSLKKTKIQHSTSNCLQ